MTIYLLYTNYGVVVCNYINKKTLYLKNSDNSAFACGSSAVAVLKTFPFDSAEPAAGIVLPRFARKVGVPHALAVFNLA